MRSFRKDGCVRLHFASLLQALQMNGWVDCETYYWSLYWCYLEMVYLMKADWEPSKSLTSACLTCCNYGSCGLFCHLHHRHGIWGFSMFLAQLRHSCLLWLICERSTGNFDLTGWKLTINQVSISSSCYWTSSFSSPAFYINQLLSTIPLSTTLLSSSSKLTHILVL